MISGWLCLEGVQLGLFNVQSGLVHMRFVGSTCQLACIMSSCSLRCLQLIFGLALRHVSKQTLIQVYQGGDKGSYMVQERMYVAWALQKSQCQHIDRRHYSHHGAGTTHATSCSYRNGSGLDTKIASLAMIDLVLTEEVLF